MCFRLMTSAVLLVGAVCFSPSVSAFGVGTHQHIGGSVAHSIATNNCSFPVEIAGSAPFMARVNERACRSIRTHWKAFLAGAIGPDAFPDLIVGQMTTHPGVEGGWQAADWIRHLLTNASTDEEFAFALGYVVHSATDVFAHSYVNHYAGDIFHLAQGGTIAEARHFALEKFIDVMLLRQDALSWGVGPNGANPHAEPITVELNGEPPLEWLAKVMIMDQAASAQYERVPAAAHLLAMRQVTRAIAGVGEEYRQVRERLLQQSSQLAADVLLANTGLTGAKALLEGAETYARSMEAAWGLAKDALSVAEREAETLRKNLDGIANDLKEVNDLFDKLERELAFSSEARNRAKAELDGLTRAVLQLEADVARECVPDRVCTERSRKDLCWKATLLGGWWFVCFIPETVCEDVVRAACGVLKGALRIEAGKLEAANAAFNTANDLYENISSQLSAGRVRKAAIEVAKGYAEAQLAVAQVTLDAARKVALEHQRFFEEATAKLGEAQEELKAAENRLGLATAIQQSVEPIVKRVDLIDIYLRDWEAGSKRAARQYIQASWDAAKAVAAGESGTEPYLRWLDCSYRLLLGVPGGLLDLECNVRDAVKKTVEDLQGVLASLPQELQWLINPMGTLVALLESEIKEELAKAVSTATDAIAGKPTGRFLQMLSGYAKVDEGLLTRTFDDAAGDSQRILRLPNIVAMVYEDISATFRPQAFAKPSSEMDNVAQQIAEALNAKSAKAGVGGPVLDHSPLIATGGKLQILPEIKPIQATKPSLFTQYIAHSEFKAYRNARTLSALALLDPEELNRLVRHIAPDFKSVTYHDFATPLYDERVHRPFTLLYDAVRSLDGNHQWQTYGLPYPRSSLSAEPTDPSQRRFGFGIHDHPEKGLRLFADPLARVAVFNKLFDGPIEGALLRHPAMQPAVYGFVACRANPFPAATTDAGEPASSDTKCEALAALQAPALPLPRLDPRTPNMVPKPIIKVTPKHKIPALKELWDAVEASGK